MNDIIVTLAERFRALASTESDLAAFVVMMVSFISTVIIARAILLLWEKIHFLPPLRWSGLMLALLTGAAFWGAMSMSLFGLSVAVVDPGIRHRFYSFGDVIHYWIFLPIVAQIFVDLYSILVAVPMLICYLVYPKTPRWLLLASVVVSLVLGEVWNVQLRLDNYGQAHHE